MAPASPTARPTATREDGASRASRLATSAANSGVAPFSIPASADETCRSANGNMLSGTASHNTPSAAVFTRSSGRIGRRADGTNDSVAKPSAIRTTVSPMGATACSPSAMNRNEAPQMTPGTTISNESSCRPCWRGSPRMPLFDLDRDSVSRLVRCVLFRVRRRPGDANIVGLRVRMIVEIQDDAIQQVLVQRALLARSVVDAQDAHVFVFEFDLVVRAVHRRRIELRRGGGGAGRALQVDLENPDGMIADVFGDVGPAGRNPAYVAAAKLNPGSVTPAAVPAAAGHHAVIEIDHHAIRGVSGPRVHRHPRLQRRDDDARLGRIESRCDRYGLRRILRLSVRGNERDGGQERRVSHDLLNRPGNPDHECRSVFRACGTSPVPGPGG